jgi:hypothetical protein
MTALELEILQNIADQLLWLRVSVAMIAAVGVFFAGVRIGEILTQRIRRSERLSMKTAQAFARHKSPVTTRRYEDSPERAGRSDP